MTNHLNIVDYIVFVFYFILVAFYGWRTYRKKKAQTNQTKEFFLAEGSLTWWAIGASLIASNISAEQFIGNSGAGFEMGLGIASYEFMSGITLLIVAVFFMPIYIKNNISTMPQFLLTRYDKRVSVSMTIFWLLLYVLINLTSIIYLGAIAISSLTGINFSACMIMLSFFAMLLTLGGMKVIAYTDVIQVIFLIVGGLATTWVALKIIAEKFGATGVLDGFSVMIQKAPDHFDMILDKSSPHFMSMPGLTALLGGMWIANLNYWGFNQYITQRALGADLKTARNGLLFAGFLKLLMPIIVCLPGIAVYVLHQHGDMQTEMLKDGVFNKDNAYPALLNLLSPGLKGLAFAALTAAIVASLAGKLNSISTIFTLDVYKKYIKKDASETQQLIIGRISIIAALFIAVGISPFLGIDKKGGFEFIQEYTGFVSPGVVAVFLLGFFWKRTTATSALMGLIGGFVLSIVLKFLPGWINLAPLNDIGFAVKNISNGNFEIPFLDRMGIVFLFVFMLMIGVSLLKKSTTAEINENTIVIDKSLFKVSNGFLIGSAILICILIFIYIYFW